MSNTKKPAAQSTNKKERDLFAETLSMQAKIAATAAHLQANLAEQSAGLTFEIFDFVSDRFGKNIAATQELGRCATVEQAFATLGEFQKKALEDYTCETARLSAQTTFSADAIREEIEADAQALDRIARGRAA